MKFILSGIFKRNYNNKGMTLIEVLLAMAILGVIAGPVLSVTYFSMARNRTSRIIMLASSMSQKAMEGLKAKPIEFFEANPSGFYYEDNEYTIEYTITPSSSYELPQGNVSRLTSTSLEFTVGSSSFGLYDRTGVLGIFELSTSYYLEFTGSASPYSFTLKRHDAIGEVLNTGLVESKSGVIDISVNISEDWNANSQPLVIHTLIDNLPDYEKVDFYISGNSDGFKLYNDGSKILNQFYNLSSEEYDFESTMYKITIISKTKGENAKELGRIESYVVR